MSSVTRTLLLADDEEAIRFAVGRYFAARGFQVHVAASVAEAVAVFRQNRPDVALVDYSFPDGDGLTLLTKLRQMDSLVPIVMLTGHATIDLAVRAVQEGADHFVTKPIELAALAIIVERLLENQRNRQARLAGRSRQARQSASPFLGDSPAIRELELRATRLASSSRPVLIQGETGTGKGVLAAWLHQTGPRAEDAFVDLNCGGLTREFLETELFGHGRGAFTGALSDKLGLLEVAHRGTLFLDEVGDLPLEVQPKLLKVLEEQRFRRLGEVRDRQVDVRLIAASHRELEGLVRVQKFREDLYFRLNTLQLQMPPLRERGADVLVLAQTLLPRCAAEVGRSGMTLSVAAERALLAHSWPGNVRELRNVLERAALMAPRDELTPEDLFERRREAPTAAARPQTLAAAEKEHIRQVLDQLDWRAPDAAKLLGLSRSALYKKMRKHDLKRAEGGR